jgi:molybdenum cofactor biosynthesis enzyme MoaA
MNIQSISIVVPTKGCVNNCKFCVSQMHESPYEDKFDELAYRKRIKYAAMNGVNTLILTGTGEALQNTRFLEKLQIVLDKENHPFPNVELQTTGVMLTNQDGYKDGGIHYPNIELLKNLGVNTIALSVSELGRGNWDIIGTPEKLRVSLNNLCEFIKYQGFNLRLSLNLTNKFDDKTPEEIFMSCKGLGAEQITFRKLWAADDESPQTKWVETNSICDYKSGEGRASYGIIAIEDYIRAKGDKLYKLPFGAFVYSIHGMSTVLDDDCMAKDGEEDDSLKYVILQENGKLYCRWDDEGSLIF